MSQSQQTLTISSTEEQQIDESIRTLQAQFALTIGKISLVASSILVVVALLAWIFLQAYGQLLGTALAFVAVAATAFACIRLHRQGHVAAAMYVLLLGIGLSLALMPVLVPETAMFTIVAYITLIPMAIQFLGARRSRLMIVIYSLSIVAIITYVAVHPQPLDMFPPLPASVSIGTQVLLGAFVLIPAIYVLRLIVLGQDEALKKSHRATMEVERRVAEEQSRRQYLQSTVEQYVKYMDAVEAGNLSARISLETGASSADDPLITLGVRLNRLTEALQTRLHQIRDAANNLSTAAAEILASSTQQFVSANEQSAAITQTSTTADELKSIAAQSMKRAQDMAGSSQRTVEVSRAGQQSVQSNIEGMQTIRERVESIAKNILALSEKTQQIGEIIASVNDIAEQSKMLALNASIEASRAGEEGKGFSVVAMEVRNLAEQSREATNQVRQILNEIQQATNVAVMATEEGAKRVGEGTQLAEQAGNAIEQLGAVIEESAQAAAQMVAGGRQQALGVEQVADAMASIKQATLQSLESTRQVEKAAQDLNDLAHSLNETVKQYQL